MFRQGDGDKPRLGGGQSPEGSMNGSGTSEQKPWAPMYQIGVQRSAFSTSSTGRGPPFPHGNFAQPAQLSFTGRSNFSGHPVWPSSHQLPPPQPVNGSHVQIPIAAHGRASSVPAPVPPDGQAWGRYYLGGMHASANVLPPGFVPPAEATKQPEKQPKYLFALHVAALVTLLVHVPLGVFFSNNMGVLTAVLVIAPIAVLLGFVSATSAQCDCAPNATIAARRIRRFATAAAVLDAIAAILVPVGIYNRRCRKKSGRHCEDLLVVGRGMSFVVSGAIVVHLVFCLIVRSQSAFLARYNHQREEDTHQMLAGYSHPSHSSHYRSFTTPQRMQP